MQTLADLLGLSFSQLDRKFKDFLEYLQPNYIQEVRLATVASGLLNTDKTIRHWLLITVFMIIVNSQECSNNSYGVSPIKYRNKSNL